MVWEERWHPLRREWVVIAAHRNNRPWRGETVDGAKRELPPYDPTCYLCPGNERVSSHRNDAYTGVFVFDNDHPCVGPAAPAAAEPPPGIYRSRSASGLSRVVCFTPRHDLTLAELSCEEIVNLLSVLQDQHRDLSARPEVRGVLMFENKGEVVGVSNPHPHCQIYATNFLFRTLEVEAAAAAEHLRVSGRTLLGDIIDAEDADGRRVLASQNQALSFIPYFARYAYETYVAPRESHPHIAALSRAELGDFAEVLRETLVRFDNLWRMPFPYVMVLHQLPIGVAADGFHFHIQIHPPLRKPGLLKYLAGPEIGGGNFLNDTSPEEKAAELQAASTVHYKSAAAHV
jgi:UDPglucose--hexose-1-phosphate uridylyltransferase